MHRASIEPAVKDYRNFHLRAGTRQMMATLCCKTAKLQNFKTANLPLFPALKFPLSVFPSLTTLHAGADVRTTIWSHLFKYIFRSISCSILASSTTSSYRWSYKETAGVAIIRDKDVCQLLSVQRMISIMCECKQLQRNVPKLDCEWKAWRLLVHQTFRSCTL